MKKLLPILALLLLAALGCPPESNAQYVNVTAVVKDPNNTLYQNCTYSANFVGQYPGTGANYLFGGSTFQRQYNGFRCDSNANLAIRLPDNNVIQPTPSQWSFSVCDQTGKYCFSTLITITGASQDITTALQTASAILPRIGNTLPAFGNGSSVTTTSLGAPPTAGNCVEWLVGGVLGDQGQPCGTGGGGGSSASPQNSLQIAGLSGAFGSSNIRVVNATNYVWTQAPSTPTTLTGAVQATITMSPCPLGLDGTYTWSYIHIGTTGTPEDVPIQGGTCTSGAGSGTLIITPANSHGAGYTLTSSTQGWQEASNDASYVPTNPSGTNQSGHVIGGPGEYTWTARMSVRRPQQTLDFSGTIIQCSMSDTCLMMGDPANVTSIQNLTVLNFRGRPMVNNGTFPMIEDNAQASVIQRVTTRQGSGTNSFGYLIQVDNDQAADISQVDPSLGNPIRCDASFCGAAVYAPGPFATNAAVGYVHNSNLTMNCKGNGIDWQSGNTLRVSDTVIQGFDQFGIRTGIAAGGFGPTQLDNVYEEVGACTNQADAKLGQAGLIAEGQKVFIRGGEGPVGVTPQFTNSGTTGSTQFNYYIVVKDSVLGSSAPMLAGYAKSNLTAGNITVKWQRVAGTNTVTYDIIRTTGVGATTTSPYTANCTGGSVAACGSVALAQAQCAGPACSFTDSTTANTASYTVANPNYWPLVTYWPGSIFIGVPADQQNSTTTSSAVFVDDLGTVSNSLSATVNSPIGWSLPILFSQKCSIAVGLAATGVLQSCIQGDPSGNGFGQQGATLLAAGNVSGASANEINAKGRLNFYRNKGSSLESGEIITLVDSAPDKTGATFNHRPVGDAADAYIGQDTGNVSINAAGVAFNSPVSLSNYINSLPDGTSWLERLTSSNKTFKNQVIFAPVSNQFKILPNNSGFGFTVTATNPAADRTLTITDPGGAANFAFTNPTTAQTLTGTVYDTAGTGNTFKINGNQIAAVQGNTNKVPTVSGAFTTGNCVKVDASGNFVDNGSACSGGTATPGGANTQVQYNNSAAFGGMSNVLYNNATGQLEVDQLANTNQTIYGKRFTDTAPTGNFIRFQNAAANTNLFQVDVSGNGLFNGTLTVNGAVSFTTALGVASGGTGAATLTSHGVLIGEGTSAVAVTAAGTTSQCLLGATGADPAFGTCPGGVWSGISNPTGNQSLSMGTNLTTWTWGVLTGTNSGLTITDGNSTSTGALVDIKTGATSTILPLVVTALGTTNGVEVDATGTLQKLGSGGVAASAILATLAVNQGGTGATTLTNHGTVISHGTGALTSVVDAGFGNCWMSNSGADPSWQGCPGASGSVVTNPASNTVNHIAPSGDSLPLSTVTATGGTNDSIAAYGQALMAIPSTPTNSQVAGGALASRTYRSKVTCVDNIGGETTISNESTQITVSLNNLVVVTGPTTSNAPLGCQGFRPYVTLANGATNTETLQTVDVSHCSALAANTPLAACAVGGTWTEDTGGTTSGAAVPGSNTAKIKNFWIDASGNLNLTGTFVGYNLAAFLPGNLTATWTGQTWTAPRNITVTRLQATAKTAPSGCGTNAKVRVSNGSSNIDLTLTAAANDSGTISQNFTAGDVLTVAVQTAASGCGTSPADVNVVMQYGTH